MMALDVQAGCRKARDGNETFNIFPTIRLAKATFVGSPPELGFGRIDGTQGLAHLVDERNEIASRLGGNGLCRGQGSNHSIAL